MVQIIIMSQNEVSNETETLSWGTYKKKILDEFKIAALLLKL